MMFITDFVQGVLRYNLFGAMRTVLVDTKISRPSGIAVDPITKMVYWTDTGRDVIEGMDYYGLKR